MAQLKDFSGGLNIRVAPQLLQITEAQIYDNIDNTKGSLLPLKDKTFVQHISNTSFHYYYDMDIWVSEPSYVDFVEYNKKLYFTSLLGRPKVYDGYNTYLLGIEKPNSRLLSSNVTEIDATVTESSTVNGLEEGTVHKYVLAHYKFNGLLIELSKYVLTVGSNGGEFTIKPNNPIASDFYVLYKEYKGIYHEVYEYPVINDTDMFIGNNLLDSYNLADKPDNLNYTTNNVDGNLDIGTYNYRLIHLTYSGDVIDYVDVTISITSDTKKGVQLYAQTTIGGDLYMLYRKYNGEYRSISKPTFNSSHDNVVLFPSKVIADLKGTYTYAYTYYDSNTGVESQPSTLSAEYKTTCSLDISGFITSEDIQVDKIRLYRSGGTLANFTLVEEIPSTANKYSDTKSDIDIAGNHILDSYNYSLCPNKLINLISNYAMLFGSVDNKLYYSDIAKPYIWPATNFIDFEAEITGIGAIQNGLLVFTKYKTYIVTGNSPQTFSKYLFDGSQGCLKHKTIVFGNNSLLWISTDGLCTINGGKVEVVSKSKYGKFNIGNSTIMNATLHDNAYYIVLDGQILCFDFNYNVCVKTITNKSTVNFIGTFNDTLYILQGTALYSMFTSDNSMVYTYKSPKLTEGSYSNYKLYKDFYIKYNGDAEFKLFVDGVLVNTKQLSGNSCYNLKALTTSHGYCIEFEINGTAEIQEIEYKALGRQNGK